MAGFHFEPDLSCFNRPVFAALDYEANYPFKSIFDYVHQTPTPIGEIPIRSRNPFPSGALLDVDLRRILSEAREFSEQFDWRALFRKSHFPVPRPSIPDMPPSPTPPLGWWGPPTLSPLPDIPEQILPQMRPSFLHVVPYLRRRAEICARNECDRLNAAAQDEWVARVEEVRNQNATALKQSEQVKMRYERSSAYLYYKAAERHWHQESSLLEQEYETALSNWELARSKYEQSSESDLRRLTLLREAYFRRERDGIENFSLLLLKRFPLPMQFPRGETAHYDAQNRILVLESQLPDFRSVSIASKDGRKLSQKVLTELQEDTLYSIALSAMFVCAACDEVGALESIVFNGWVHFTDSATGQARDAFILSVHATKGQLTSLNIDKVNPEDCFRSLKGLSAKRVTAYTPVAPILTLSKVDNRIVEGRSVIDGLSSADNLAAMDWQTFEHLVRELFEKAFSGQGAEVHITRASRDRGVDAIVFDPDPIRGGKIVIQAKRYTNTVDVSAVRDLFGTVQSEGANKGILVSTSQFGPDAYEFAKGKPITLLDGSNLLHLFEKHGYEFRIDLAEARQILGKPPVS